MSWETDKATVAGLLAAAEVREQVPEVKVLRHYYDVAVAAHSSKNPATVRLAEVQMATLAAAVGGAGQREGTPAGVVEVVQRVVREVKDNLPSIPSLFGIVGLLALAGGAVLVFLYHKPIGAWLRATFGG